MHLRLCLTIVCLLASSVTLLGASPPADACSFDATYSIDLLALDGADPADPLAALADDYAFWLEEEDGQWSDSPNALPLLLGAWYERTIVRVDGSEDWMGSGGVSVVDEVWGTMPAPHPQEYWVDNTSCAGEFEPPSDGEFRLNYEGDGYFWIRGLRTPEDVSQAKEILTSLFGEPAEPPRSADEEQAALDRVTRSDVAGPVVWLEARSDSDAGDAGTEPEPSQVDSAQGQAAAEDPSAAVEETSDGLVEDDGGFPWIFVGVAALAAGALGLVAVARIRD